MKGSAGMNLIGIREPQIYTPIKEIVLESSKKFESTIDGFLEVSPFPEYSIYKAVKSEESKFTKSANTCAILGMSNGKQTYLGHYAPELKSQKFKKQLEYDVKKMQDETGELSAIITGGYDKDLQDGVNSVRKQQITASFTQLAEIGEVLDKAGANLTMVAAKTNPSFKENLAVTPDRFILSFTPYTIASKYPDITKCKNNAEIEQELSKFYSISELDSFHNIHKG